MTLVSADTSREAVPTQPVSISPAFRRLPPPILIVGMHRSGTSMVAGMLAALGAYVDPLLNSAAALGSPEVGTRLTGYGEAVVFRHLNEAIMERTGATWKQITPFLAQRDNPRFAAGSLLRMQIATYTSLHRGYLQAMPASGVKVWGWKDPRNSLMLPYWLRLFPDARILHVRRSPNGVLDSLQRREQVWQATPAPSLAVRLKHAAMHPDVVLGKLRRTLGKSAIPIAPQKPEDWLRLSEQYVGECLKYQKHPGGYLEVHYEEILADPHCYVSKMADYVQTDVSTAQLLRAAAFILVNEKKR